MNTAQKRVQLAAAGEPWPACDCHGEPQDWQRDPRIPGGGRFKCAVARRERVAARRAARRTAGVCVQCGAGDLETESMCAKCAARHREAAWRHEQNPLRFMRKLADNRRRGNRGREAEGFRPTGVGQAAVMAVLAEGKEHGG